MITKPQWQIDNERRQRSEDRFVAAVLAMAGSIVLGVLTIVALLGYAVIKL